MSRKAMIVRRVTLFILENWWILCIGILLTAWAVCVEYENRGGFSIGGEWLITPFLILVKRLLLVMQDEAVWRCKK